MRFVNRAVLVLAPKQPFVDWVNQLGDTPAATLEALRAEAPAYLLPELEWEGDEDRLLREYWEDLFEGALFAWTPDETAWPQGRDFETFQAWFDARFHGFVLDAAPGPLKRDDDALLSPFGPPPPEYSEAELERTLNRVKGWARRFAESEACAALSAQQRELAEDIVLNFTEFMYTDLGLTPEEWEVETLLECCLGVMPAKLSAEADYFAAIAPVLSAFLDFLEREELLFDAGALAEAAREIERELVEAAADPANWGMAKTFFMAAKEAGVDPTDEDALNAFAESYNRSLLGDPTGGEPVEREAPKVGRNDPCPCGSGKKYKHCCG